MRPGNTEGGRKIVRRSEADRERQRQHHQDPVDEADVEGAGETPAAVQQTNDKIVRAIGRCACKGCARSLASGQAPHPKGCAARISLRPACRHPRRSLDRRSRAATGRTLPRRRQKARKTTSCLAPFGRLSEPIKRAKWRAVGVRNASCGIEK